MEAVVRFNTSNKTQSDLAVAILNLRYGKPEVAKRILDQVEIKSP